MGFLLSFVAVVVVVLVATGAAFAFVAWLVVKWVVIAFAILGGFAGGYLLGDKGGVFIGAVLGGLLGIAVLASASRESKE